MALTQDSLARALRLTAGGGALDPDVQAVLLRILGAAEALITDYAPAAPEAIRDEATIRIASRLYDQQGADARGGNPIVASGAAHLLAPWHTRTATGGSGTTPAAGTSTAGLDTDAVLALLGTALVQGSNVTITRQDDHFVISASGNVSAHDEVARAAAATAQAAAEAAQTAADGAQGEVDALETTVANLEAAPAGGGFAFTQRATVQWNGSGKQQLLEPMADLPAGPWLVAVEETDASNEVARSALFGPGYGPTALATEVDKSVVFPFNSRFQSGAIVGPAAHVKVDWRREPHATTSRMTVEILFVSGQSADAGGYTARLLELT